MGKLLKRLQKQLSSEEYRKDAENCLKLYDHLKEISGHVWDSEWRILVSTKFKGYLSEERIYKPTTIGYTLIKGLTN
jgi:hypothetical protein